MSGQPPPTDVLRAFGVGGPARRLPGGQGTSWVAGDLVLKPGAGAVQDWLAGALADVPSVGFRLAAPVRTVHGTWSRQGWSATRWVEGAEHDRSDPATWLRIVEAGRAFHRAVASVTRPDCLDARTDAWAVADRLAWGELDIRFGHGWQDLGNRLRAAAGPLGPPQLVHGDLAGNVLLSRALPPAVLDVSPYWRPVRYAEGIVLADALLWHGAPASLPDRAAVPVTAVARGLLFRLASTPGALAGHHPGPGSEVGRYLRAAATIGL